jgi:hypothetical protein
MLCCATEKGLAGTLAQKKNERDCFSNLERAGIVFQIQLPEARKNPIPQSLNIRTPLLQPNLVPV